MAAFEAFGDMELAGWSDPDTAAAYVDLFAAASDQTIPRLLEGAGARSGLRVLDLCCGQGNVTRALAEAGCKVTGADFSPAMLAAARRAVPEAGFVKADAQDLPFEDGEFDAVVSNFGICHVPDQPRALAEVQRVLKPGGGFAMAVWCGPDRFTGFQIVYAAARAHGHPDVAIPDGPDFHQFANRETAERLLEEAGFREVGLDVVDCYWDLDRPERIYDIFTQGTVRAAHLLNHQPPENAKAIRSFMSDTVAERCAHGDGWRVPLPATVVHAVKPGG